METIIILAQAISKAAKKDIWRLDINMIGDDYVGRLWLTHIDISEHWDIYEDGTIEHHKNR